MLNKSQKAAVLLALASSCVTGAFAQDKQLDLKFAGALEFSDTGTLFVGDNYNGAIYAFSARYSLEHIENPDCR